MFLVGDVFLFKQNLALKAGVASKFHFIQNHPYLLMSLASKGDLKKNNNNDSNKRIRE